MATAVGQADSSGRNQPGALTPGNTSMGLLQGGPQSTDGNNNIYAPLVTQLVDTAGANTARIDAQNAQLVTVGGKTAAFVATATPGAVKATAGRLCRVIITTLGTASQIFYDNASAASGNILFATAASAPVGTIYDIQVPAVNGIYAAGAASTPVCTVTYN